MVALVARENRRPTSWRFAEDATEKRLLERPFQVTQKMEAIGRLSGGIAHDFNHLFGVIIGYSQVLKKKRDSSNPLRVDAKEIEKAGQRAASLTRQQVLAPDMLACQCGSRSRGQGPMRTVLRARRGASAIYHPFYSEVGNQDFAVGK